MSRDCFIAPRPARWSTGLSPLIIMINRWAMGRRGTTRGGGKEWNKRIHPDSPSGVSRSHPRVTWALRWSFHPRAAFERRNPIFSPFIDPPEERKVARCDAMRCDAPHAIAVGRPPMQISPVHCARASCPLLCCYPPSPSPSLPPSLPPSQSRHKRSRSNFHPVRNFYFPIG